MNSKNKYINTTNSIIQQVVYVFATILKFRNFDRYFLSWGLGDGNPNVNARHLLLTNQLKLLIT